jgi:hypothetical protein
MWNHEHPGTFEVLEASQFQQMHPRGGSHRSAASDASGTLLVKG